jgi:hypothetical protein
MKELVLFLTERLALFPSEWHVLHLTEHLDMFLVKWLALLSTKWA